MDAGVLANLQRREVEAERLDLPPEVLHVAPRGPRQADLDERALQLIELRDELPGAAVRAGRRRSLLGQASARPAQALGDEGETLPDRLVGKALAHGSIEVGEGHRVGREL